MSSDTPRPPLTDAQPQRPPAAEINSPADWDHNFTFAWERNKGRAQTAAFARAALAALPEPFVKLVRDQALGLLDWGCALGDALPVFAQAFPASSLIGLDISSVAITRAREAFPDWRFTTTPLRALGTQVPVVYSSNCLEHFHDPFSVLREQILPGVRDYLIALVPYQEYARCEGHFFTFDQDSFPAELDGFGLLFWRVLPARMLTECHWDGSQLLVIYARRTAIGIRSLVQALSQWQPADP